MFGSSEDRGKTNLAESLIEIIQSYYIQFPSAGHSYKSLYHMRKTNKTTTTTDVA